MSYNFALALPLFVASFTAPAAPVDDFLGSFEAPVVLENIGFSLELSDGVRLEVAYELQEAGASPSTCSARRMTAPDTVS